MTLYTLNVNMYLVGLDNKYTRQIVIRSRPIVPLYGCQLPLPHCCQLVQWQAGLSFVKNKIHIPVSGCNDEFI